MSSCAVRFETDGEAQVSSVTGPGLVDIQVNGYAGVDFCGPVEKLTLPAVRQACLAMRRRGVVAMLATIVTDAAELVEVRLRRLAELRTQDEVIASMIPGFHVEGIFISPEDGPRGAHAVQYVLDPADRPELLERFQQAAGGLMKYFTLAPERPGAIDMIARGTRAGIRMGIGHHAADERAIAEAVSAGAVICTHLGNGSHAMLPRHQNYIQLQLAEDRLAASFIADGHHICFPALKNFLRAKQFARSVLTTDAMSAADMPPGQYALGNTLVKVGQDRKVCLAGTPYLAGSALTMDWAVLNVVRHCDVPWEAAWAMASVQPAALMGLEAPPTVQVNVDENGFTCR